MPVGAFGGRAAIMDHIAPDGPVYQAGTLSGNPIAMAAGLTTLERLSRPGFYEALEQKTAELTEGLVNVAEEAGVGFSTHQVGGMFGLFFNAGPVTRFSQVMDCDIPRFQAFFHAMLEAGVYLAPSAYEAGFVSAAHSDEDIAMTLAAATAALKRSGK